MTDSKRIILRIRISVSLYEQKAIPSLAEKLARFFEKYLYLFGGMKKMSYLRRRNLPIAEYDKETSNKTF